MIFNTIKELIEQQSNCPICDTPLVAFLKERARNKENIPRKQINLINSKFKNKKFEFKLDYNSYNLDIHYKAIINDSNLLILDPQIKIDEVEYILSVLSSMFLNIEMHCFNRECKNKYYIITSVLKPQYDSSIGIYFHPFLLDWECFNLSHLWIQNDHISQVTRIYNVDSITTPPITTPFLPICVTNKEKTFNRIQTIVNFK
jgi:hypothetical protein